MRGSNPESAVFGESRSRQRHLRRLLGPVLIGLLAVGLLPASAWAAVTYYVDCNGGNDGSNGTSPSTAWRSIARANQASLSPGSKLLFKRGCTWSGTTLHAKWNGTSASPITIGGYGDGSRPLIQNSDNQVYIAGSWLIIEGLAARADPVTYDPQCQNAPAGRRSGFRLVSPAAHNILRNLAAEDLFLGIWVGAGSHHNSIHSNILRNNRMKSDIWSSDAGSGGIALHGDDNDVAYNTISGSDSCSRFYGRDGSAIDVWGGQRNQIHHNRSIDNNNFGELGDPRSADNTWAYNVVTSSLRKSTFFTTRGAGSQYGPINRSKVYNNSVYLSGAEAYALQCGSGCGPSILSLRNNIIWSAYRIGYADAAFDEGDNIYWTPGGANTVWFPISTSSMKVDPRWVAPGSGNLQLQSSSPALNNGSNHGLNMGFDEDFAGAVVPQGGVVDIGAMELVAGAPPPSTTVASDPFTRTSSSGWGSANLGGAYSYFGPSTSFSVQNGVGLMNVPPNQTRAAVLSGASARDVDFRFRVSTDVAPTGDGHWVYAASRRAADGSEYRTKLRLMPNGDVLVGISKTSGGAETPITVNIDAGINFTVGSYLLFRASVTGGGTTTLKVKVWRSGQAEPSGWTLTGTDSTAALQDSGAPALLSYAPANGRSATLRFDDLVVTSL